MTKTILKIRNIVTAGVLTVGFSLPLSMSGTAHAKDPCFFSQAEFNSWLNEKSGSPGWGDTLSQVQNISGGCSGVWDASLTPHDCPQDSGNLKTWRTWAQSDGDQVWIAFADYYPNSPRYRAHCEAGIYHPSTNKFNWYARQN